VDPPEAGPPPMAAGVADHVWTLEEIADLLLPTHEQTFGQKSVTTLLTKLPGLDLRGRVADILAVSKHPGGPLDGVSRN
jgi:hypothetical protein